MRLWHENLLPYISDKRLSGQHRECCALRGKGWGRKHATVDYVFKHSRLALYKYHLAVMNEMQYRGFHIDRRWLNPKYCGKNHEPIELDRSLKELMIYLLYDHKLVYPEHNDAYLKECLELLDKKGEHFEWKLELK